MPALINCRTTGFSEIPFTFTPSVAMTPYGTLNSYCRTHTVRSALCSRLKCSNARENVAVHHQQRFVNFFEQTERAGGAERLIFFHVANVDAKRFAFFEVIGD